MSVFTLQVTDIDDEDAEWLRSCRILRVNLDETGITFMVVDDE